MKAWSFLRHTSHQPVAAKLHWELRGPCLVAKVSGRCHILEVEVMNCYVCLQGCRSQKLGRKRSALPPCLLLSRMTCFQTATLKHLHSRKANLWESAPQSINLNCTLTWIGGNINLRVALHSSQDQSMKKGLSNHCGQPQLQVRVHCCWLCMFC